MDKDLIAASQMFLIPAAILFTALGVAQTEGLKTGISAIGLVISATWCWRVWVWRNLSSADRKAALAFSGIFVLASAIAFCAHGLQYGRDLSWF